MVKRIPGHPGRIVSFIRNFLIGRSVDASPWLRSRSVLSPRSPPPPNLPPGPAHKLASNYYCSRDLRRDVAPPTSLMTHQQISEASEEVTIEEVAFPQLITPPTPGTPHRWTFKQD